MPALARAAQCASLRAVFVPHHSLVTATGAVPARWMLVLHGIYGSGANWRTFASKLVERQPDWGLVLVDLRMHGRSQDAPPPHTVAAAAADLGALRDLLARDGKPVRAVAGHSFGGKVALAYRASQADHADHAGSNDDSLAHTWVFDASPTAFPAAMDSTTNTVIQVLRMLAALPPRFASRGAFVAHVTGQGFAPMLASWLAMNLEPAPDDPAGGYVMRLDPAVMEALLRDFHGFDAWPALAGGPGIAHMIVAGASNTVSAADRQRIDDLIAGGAALTVDVIPGASHWLHIDGLDTLLDLVAGALARPA
jgi:esterase